MTATLLIVGGFILAVVLIIAFAPHDPEHCPECLATDQETPA